MYLKQIEQLVMLQKIDDEIILLEEELNGASPANGRYDQPPLIRAICRYPP